VKTYETLFIINPDIDEAETTRAVDIVQDVITTGGGSIIRVDKWGKRQLAYQIQKKREGYYVLMFFQAPPGVMTELNRRYKLTDTIMRHLIIQLPENKVEEILQSKSLTETSSVVSSVLARNKSKEDDMDLGLAGDLDSNEELMTSREGK
jgi:small subunit ribosomal protein S6